MVDQNWLAQKFEQNRPHLRAVAYRMLGSLSEADDAVQEAWLRLNRSDPNEIENLGGWLTTVIGRVCLDLLRSRKSRREEPLDAHMPDPILSREDGIDPEVKRCSPTRWASRFSLSWKHWLRPSAWHSYCTTCSAYRSTRSLP